MNASLEYREDKSKIHGDIVKLVEAEHLPSAKEVLEAHDGIARLRAEWDQIARNYDVIITPSAIDEAPEGLENTGIAVGPSSGMVEITYICMQYTYMVLYSHSTGLLHHVDDSTCACHERARIQRQMRAPDRSHGRGLPLQRHGRSPRRQGSRGRVSRASKTG